MRLKNFSLRNKVILLGSIIFFISTFCAFGMITEKNDNVIHIYVVDDKGSLVDKISLSDKQKEVDYNNDKKTPFILSVTTEKNKKPIYNYSNIVTGNELYSSYITKNKIEIKMLWNGNLKMSHLENDANPEAKLIDLPIVDTTNLDRIVDVPDKGVKVYNLVNGVTQKTLFSVIIFKNK
jgi:hypothetical protein